MLIFFELCSEVISANGRYKLVMSKAHVFVAVAKGSNSAGPGGWHLVQDIASA